MPHYTLFPWARPDFKNLPVDTLTDAVPASAKVPLELAVNDNAPVRVDAALDGPADVLGIDIRQITRREPSPGTQNFEANYFAAIEFARPDFPWLFTPATADADGRLRPWLVLAVVRKQPGVAIHSVAQQLPRLEIKSPAQPADELPDLAQSWAWAHAQLDDRLQQGETLQTVLASNPVRLNSRLLCPRRLQPNSAYLACVVPAFEVGRLAGLGLSTEAVANLEPAWKPAASSVTMPVYHHWEFATGDAGDFESLLKLLLEPIGDSGEPPRGRLVDASRAAEGLPAATGGAENAGTFTLECPLVPLGSKREWDADFAAKFSAALRPFVTPAQPGTDPRLTPPLYAAQHAGQSAVPADDAPPHWLRELNLDPRFRVAAALGGEVIRRNQERLVDAAWDQAGDVQDVNKLLRHAQLAMAAAASVHRRHFSRLTDSALVEITRPLHSRIAVSATQTFQGFLAQSATPTSMVAAEFRRASRPRGPVFRQAVASNQRVARSTLAKFAAQPRVFLILRPPTVLATPDAVEARFKAGGGVRPPNLPAVAYHQFFSLWSAGIPQRPLFAVTPPALPSAFPVFTILQPEPVGAPDSEAAKRFRAALEKHLPLLQPKEGVMTAQREPLAVGDVRAMLLARLDPKAQFATSVRAMVQVDGASAVGERIAAPAERLDPLRLTPHFTEPLYSALGEISPDLVVQGFEAIANNSITPLETNTPFVEAFLAGANHEMARELVWREYPVNERATFFAHFWDSQGRVEGLQPDIPPLAQWNGDSRLGGNAMTGSLAVFLIRGELVRRYPTAIIHLVEALWPAGQERPTLGQNELQPALRGRLSADAAFVGFAVDPAKVAARPGWFFVVQEPPGEPRFGVEADVPPGPLTPETDAGRTAKRFLQRPVRIAIHASDLLPRHA